MKKCVRCQAEIQDDAMYCTQCGFKQPESSTDYTEAVPEKREQNEVEKKDTTTVPPPEQSKPAPGASPQRPPQPQQGQYYGPPPQGQAPMQHAYGPKKQESKLQKDGKRYFTWLKEGLLGSDKDIHPLLAVIAPILISIFYSLALGPYINWRAGAYFSLLFIFAIFYIVFFFASYLINRYYLKDTMKLGNYLSRFSSLQTLVFFLTFITFIINLFGSSGKKLAALHAHGGGFGFLFVRLIPILIFVAVIASLSLKNKTIKERFVAILIIALVAWVLINIFNLVFFLQVNRSYSLRARDFFNNFSGFGGFGW